MLHHRLLGVNQEQEIKNLASDSFINNEKIVNLVHTEIDAPLGDPDRFAHQIVVDKDLEESSEGEERLFEIALALYPLEEVESDVGLVSDHGEDSDEEIRVGDEGMEAAERPVAIGIGGIVAVGSQDEMSVMGLEIRGLRRRRGGGEEEEA